MYHFSSVRPGTHFKTPGKTYHTEECAASTHAVGGQHGRMPGRTR